MTTDATLLTRRSLLRAGALASGALALGPAFWRAAVAEGATPTDGPYGPLGRPDKHGLQLPAGFRARLIARGNELVPGTAYRFPVFPDGQATFALPGGGFVLVTNSEAIPPDAGVSAIRFDAQGQIVNAYRILGGTFLNCAGGPTPWGTWLSCEEVDEGGGSPGGPSIPVGIPLGRGAVWECDPTQPSQGVRRPKMGLFKHEAVAVDPVGQCLYLTEDNGDGAFYRFTPDAYPNLESGTLEVALVEAGGHVRWLEAPEPDASPPAPQPKHQVADYTRFDRGEGMWFDSGVVYVATTGDGRIHAYDCASETISVVYDEGTVTDAPLNDVDNITVSPSGDLYAAEDNGLPDDGIDVAILTPDRTVSRFLRATGPKHTIETEPFGASELTGPVFDPSGTRFFVTSQRARKHKNALPVGEVYEITGPFRLERPSTGITVPATVGQTIVPGQAIGSGQSPLPDARLVGPALGVEVPRRILPSIVRRDGLPVRLTLDEPATVSAVLRADDGRRLGEVRRRLERRGPHELRVPAAGTVPPRAVVEVTIGDETFVREVLLPPQPQKATSSRARPTPSS